MSQDKTLTATVISYKDHAIVRVEGRVIRENQAQLRAELESMISQGISHLALDLAGVQYMDSSGLGCLSSIENRLRRHGPGRIAVFGATPNVEKTWRMIRLDLLIPLFANEGDAVAWLTGPREDPG